MLHRILPVGLLQCNCSIFGDPESGEAVVVDPGDDIGGIERLLAADNLRVKAILITHAHIDHIGGAAKLKAHTGAPVYMNQRDSALYREIDVQAAWLGVATPQTTSIDVDAREGGRIQLGPAEMHFIETPGHTPGSISLWIPAESKLAAGDTLFFDSIGRTDLPGGDGRAILRSIRDKILVLPEETVVIPGHGPNTTIGREKQRNPFLRGL
jgi:hydroxyacylglutathione hydrolase